MRKVATKQILSFRVPYVKMILMFRSAGKHHTAVCYKQTPGKSGDAAKGFVLQVPLKYRQVKQSHYRPGVTQRVPGS